MRQPAVYSNKEIMTALMARDIIIESFDTKNLGTSSYDLRLGDWYYEEQKPDPALTQGIVFNPYQQESVLAVWGEAKQAQPVTKTAAVLFGLREGDLVIWIDPGETILAHTQEFVGGRDHITTMMKARSSFGRCFIEVCKCAGWGDVGYINRWTMEITNNSRYYRIPLIVGMRISQMVFFETGDILNLKADYAASGGKYQSFDSTKILKIKAAWVPEMMLPRLHLDRELRK